MSKPSEYQCQFCNQTINARHGVFDCRNHPDWDVRYIFTSTLNSGPILDCLSFKSKDNNFWVKQYLIEKVTIFFQKTPGKGFTIIADMPKVIELTPDNATHWFDRITKLKAFL